MRVNLPARTQRYYGALAGRRAALEQRIDQVNFEVQEAYAQADATRDPRALSRKRHVTAPSGSR